jgi:hypothetical protein
MKALPQSETILFFSGFFFLSSRRAALRRHGFTMSDGYWS